MATIMNNAAYMGFPLSIKRGNPAPVDTTAVWYNKTELETYAASGATAYVGQILTLIADSKCEAYMISNEAGTLIKLASTTASGDLASDVATLQGQVADLISKVGKAAEGEVSATGLYALIDEVKILAEGKVASVGATDKSITVGGTATKPTVGVAISADEGNALSLAADGLKVTIPELTVPVYSVVEDKTSTEYSAVYHLTKDGENIGAAINIPKDMVVKSGTVETNPTGKPAGTYLVLTLANATEDKIYINVGDLIEYVTAGESPDGMVVISVSDDHKVTATLGDASITEAKLHADVKAKLAKAVSAVQEVKAGTTNGTITVDGNEVAVAGLADAAYVTVASLNNTAQDKADAVKSEVVGGKDDNDAALSIYGAKAYAKAIVDSAKADLANDLKVKIESLDAEDTAVAKQFVSAVSETDGKITVERRALLADDVPELGISKISGLQAALNAKQDTVTFDGEYSATNKAATVNTVNSAVAAVVSNGKDVAADDTIKGAKKYADEKATATLSSAKEYADSIVTGTGGITARVETLEGKVDVTKVSTAISTAKDEAIAAAATASDTKDTALKTAILGAADYTQTVKSAYELAASKATMTEVEAKDYATKTEAQDYADAKDTAIADAKKAGTDAMAKIGTIPEGATATTAIDYVDEKIAAIPAQTDYTVTCNTTTPEGYAKRYTLSQCGNQIASIDIPSDMVVSSGKVVENPAGQTAGTYIELTLANATKDKIYINVGDLIEYVTGAAAADGIITTSVDDNHVLTATIGDGTITKTKLATAVQTSLGKADTALQAAALEPYAKTADVAAGYVAKATGKDLIETTLINKLKAIDADAQVNKIETIKVGGATLAITDKAVDITEISTDLLKQGTQTLVLMGGNAATLA